MIKLPEARLEVFRYLHRQIPQAQLMAVRFWVIFPILPEAVYVVKSRSKDSAIS